MYKIVGCLFLIFAITLFFYRRCIRFYCTCRYIGYILNLLDDMKIACMYGKTYKPVFESFERQVENDLFFKICFAFCSENLKYETDSILINSGKRIKEDEEIYLEYNKKILKDKYTEYMTKFKENNKISLLMGFYVAVVIILLIV